jgi:hypothetical protein
MTVFERLYDNAWFVQNADPEARADLLVEVTRATADVMTARAAAIAEISATGPEGAVARSHLFAALASLDRARERAEAAARCTDVVDGHAFAVRESLEASGCQQLVVTSCTLTRQAVIVRDGGPDQRRWFISLSDPDSRRPGAAPAMAGSREEALAVAFRWIAEQARPAR